MTKVSLNIAVKNTNYHFFCNDRAQVDRVGRYIEQCGGEVLQVKDQRGHFEILASCTPGCAERITKTFKNVVSN